MIRQDGSEGRGSVTQFMEMLALMRRGTDLEQQSCADKDALDTGYGRLVRAVGQALGAGDVQLTGEKCALLSALCGFTPPPHVPTAVPREDVDGAPTGCLSYVVTAQAARWVARLASAARQREISVLVVGPNGAAEDEDGTTAATSFAKRFAPDSFDIVIIADADRVPLPVGILAGMAARSAVWVVGCDGDEQLPVVTAPGGDAARTWGRSCMLPKLRQRQALLTHSHAILVTDDDSPEEALPPEVPAFAESSGPALYAWQRDALAAWRAHERLGVVEAVTGTGKSRVAVDAIAETIEAGGRVLVIVPTIDLVDQWHSMLTAAFPQLGGQVGRYDDRPGAYPSLIHQRIIVSTVHTASRGVTLPDGALCLLVADECHHYGAATFRLALDDRFQRRLGLTATYERYDDGREHLDAYFGGPPVYSLDFTDAIAAGVAAHFRLALVGVRLTARERADYDELNARYDDARRALASAGVTDADPAAFLDEARRIARSEQHPLKSLAAQYVQAFLRRLELLAQCSGKVAALARLRPAFLDSDGALAFTYSVATAELAALELQRQGLRAAALFGRLRAEQRRSRLRQFTVGDLDVLCAPKVLDEGVDIPRADLAVVIGGSTSRRQMIQRMGRVLRRKPDAHQARMVILYVEGTAEDPSSDGRGHEMFLATATRAADAWHQFGAETSADTIYAFLAGDGEGQPPTPVPQGEADKRGAPSSLPGRRAEGNDLLRDLHERGIDAWSAAIEDGQARIGGRPDVIEQLVSLLYRAHLEQAADEAAMRDLMLLLDRRDDGEPLVVTGWRVLPDARRVMGIGRLSVPPALIGPLLRTDPGQVRAWLDELRRGDELRDQVRDLLAAGDVTSYRRLCEIDPPPGLLREELPPNLSARLTAPGNGPGQLPDVVTVGIELMLKEVDGLSAVPDVAQRAAGWCVAIAEAADFPDSLSRSPFDERQPLGREQLRRLVSRVDDDLNDRPVDTGLLWSDITLLYQRGSATAPTSDGS